MTRDDCEVLIEYLRRELEAYGALLAHFDRQQQALFVPDPDALLEFAQSMETSIKNTDRARKEREHQVAEIVTRDGHPEGTTLRQLIPSAPEVFHPMFDSFVREINRLVHGVRRRSRQNHEMLNRAYQMHREAVEFVSRDRTPATYGAQGRLRSPHRGALSAAG